MSGLNEQKPNLKRQKLLSSWVSTKNQKPCSISTSEELLKSSTVLVSTSDSSQSITTTNNNDFSTDIANYLQGSNPSDYNIVRLLEMTNIPSNDFVYPFSVHLKKGKEEKRFLKRTHFENFNWLLYSTSRAGLFCKYCVLFANKGGKDKNITLNKFVHSPLTKYAKILGAGGDFNVHSNHIYHKNAVQVALNFLYTYKNPQREIINIMNSNRMKTVAENRERLRPIIESIIFLGRQNIAIRGHRDQGKLNTTTSSSVINEGNFRELLKFRVSSGDTILEEHLKSCNSKATYISHTTQENIINCCKDELLAYILNEVKEAKYYSVIFDETTDISQISQLSLVLRYVDNNQNVHERFIGFINCHDYAFQKNKICNDIDIDTAENKNVEPKLTGEVLGNIVLSAMKDMSLDLSNCVGIGTDGCSVMTSVLHGAVQQVQSSCKNAIFSPCSNHALNLSISKSSNVQLVRNNMSIIKEILTFFNMSSKRSFILKNNLKGCKRSITRLCDTRWVERHDSIFEFQLCLKEIIDSLVCISEWTDVLSSSKAKTLLLTVCTCEFVITLYTMSDILSITAAASKILQGTIQDVFSADDCISITVKNLEDKRLNGELKFKELFEKCKTIMTELDINIKVPRTSKHQIHRSNTPASCPEEYFRRVLYIPVLDNILQDIHLRFYNKKNNLIFSLMQLVPVSIIKLSSEKCDKLINSVTEHFSFLEINEIALKGEIELWKSKWVTSHEKGKS